MHISEAEGIPVAILVQTLNMKDGTRVVSLFNRRPGVLTDFAGSASAGCRRNLLRLCGGVHPNRPLTIRDTRDLVGTVFFSPEECSLTGIKHCGFGGGLRLGEEVINRELTRSIISTSANRVLTRRKAIIAGRVTGAVRGDTIPCM